MLAELRNYEDFATLVMQSGVQFMDFATKTEMRREEPGQFLDTTDAVGVIRLVADRSGDKYHLPGQAAQFFQPTDDVPLDETVRLLAGVWLPVPFLRLKDATDGRTEAVEGPGNWVRAHFMALGEGEDPSGYTLRVTLAFDTKVYDDNDQRKYLAPTHSDLRNGARYSLFSESHQIAWMMEQAWLREWLGEVFLEQAQERLRMTVEDAEAELSRKNRHLKHYLNFLAIIAEHIEPPKIAIIANADIGGRAPIDVDMVLDIGNSRTCGILVEDHVQETNGLKKRYELELRDISNPHYIYCEPFESRAEFVKAQFGKEDHSAASGRIDAFLWPTIARVGPEATRMAARRRGTEGATGISSPKRYLWDEESYARGWVLHSTNPNEFETPATVSPFTDFINDKGDALYADPDGLPVFNPQYCRSSLMTFMIAEIIAQALVQINSPSQRLSMSHANTPRHLRRVVLTVPPSMPMPERTIFAKRVEQAMALVWKALGWHPEDADMSEGGRAQATPSFPEVRLDWDEATCAQVVYLFSETQNHFNGHPEEFFRVIQRPDTHKERPRTVRIASIDIGGGTSDVVISDYSLDDGPGGNVYIHPNQLFRDGFKVAGDDILLEVIQHTIVKDIERALSESGVNAPEVLLSRLLGDEGSDVQLAQLRQQLALQVMQPLGHHVLKLYENFDPAHGGGTDTVTIGGFFDDGVQPSSAVFDYFNNGVRDELPPNAESFDLRDVTLNINLDALHRLFLSNEVNISKTLGAMCEVVYLYNCDVLLLSGRPSRLPGVQAVVRALLPLPPDRILPLHNYRTGNWYPFHKQGRIDDPKTTAAVGAMLCMLGQGRIPRFFFRADAFKVRSTVRYVGMMDQGNTIKNDEVFYADVDLDHEDYTLPEKTFDMRGPTVIGFRQLNASRWSASQLYLLNYADEKARLDLFGKTLAIQLEHDRKTQLFKIQRAEVKGTGQTVSRSKLTLKFNTLQGGSMGEQSYWLDTGCIVS